MSILKKIVATAVCAASLGAMNAHATVMNIGWLKTDTQTGLTTDVHSGRLYTRFDAFNLTYADLLTALAPGGAWAGWSIATPTVSDDFVVAALSGIASGCIGTVPDGTQCGIISEWIDGDLGASFQPIADYYAFLNPDGGIGVVGFYQVGVLIERGAWGTTPLLLDQYKGAAPINFLLYKDINAVPEPGTLALFGLGLLGIGPARRRLARQRPFSAT